MAKEKQIVIRIDKNMENELKSHARSADRSMAQTVRLAIKEYLWAHPPKDSELPQEAPTPTQ